MPRRAKILRFVGPARPAPDGDALVEVHRGVQAEALVVKGLLESAGIPAALRSRLALSVHPFTIGSQGEVAVMVPVTAAHQSSLILSRSAPEARPDAVDAPLALPPPRRRKVLPFRPAEASRPATRRRRGDRG